MAAVEIDRYETENENLSDDVDKLPLTLTSFTTATMNGFQQIGKGPVAKTSFWRLVE